MTRWFSIIYCFWQSVSLANPLLYMVNAFRYGILGVSDINIYVAFIIILLFILALSSLYLPHRGTGIKTRNIPD